ncbi:hypothetical protein LTR84_004628 [Exophiala bonariae]|uniref:Uncharacterized protein n=1 Tax=Exophiala bonariae TaxID=1690606 RepID=A0AAV9NR68_9EURO|nr:hypothetical protein LTR84_004628 [Exophiala bonariae]
MKYFAYKLGYLSRLNIRHEAQKPEPHLCKLLGHALLFDNARNYINEHLDDEELKPVEVETLPVLEWEEFEDDATIQYIEDIEDDPTSIMDAEAIQQPVSSSHKEPSLQLVNTPRTLSILHASSIESRPHCDQQWENGSNASTEAGDDDEGHWSDTTYEEEDIDPPLLHCGESDPFLLKTADPGYPLHKSEDDDIVLWSQQPRVLSLRQVEDIFVEAFG